jgi:hypothetical protein
VSHSDILLTSIDSAVNISVWSTIELGTGIVAGSLATMRPLLKRMYRIGREHMTLHTKVPGSGGNNNGGNNMNVKSIGGGGGGGGGKPVSFKSSVSKHSRPSPALDIESLPSVFRPWESVGESQGYTTTVIGGHEIEKELKSMQNTMNRSIDMVGNLDHANRSVIWPFVEEGGIAKVVDVRVSVSHITTPTSTEPSPASASPSSASPLAAKSWARRFEDLVKKPERSHTNTNNTVTSLSSIHNLQFSPHNTRNNTRRNTYIDINDAKPGETAEWDRIPDLMVLSELSRRSTEDEDDRKSVDIELDKSEKSGGSSSAPHSPSSK